MLFLASLILHHRPSLWMRDVGVTLQQDPEEGEAASRGSSREGGQYRCSCPMPATRKSPAAENLRLLTKPTWRGQGRKKGQGRVRGSPRLLVQPERGSLSHPLQNSHPAHPSIPRGCPGGAPASEILHHTSRASHCHCGTLGHGEGTVTCSSPGMGAGHVSPTGWQKQLPLTCGQEVTAAQGSHC